MSPLLKRLLLGFVALVVVVLGGALGYYLLGDGRWAPFDCVYMTVITVTTVGYGEMLPHMDEVHYARTFTVVLLIFGTGAIVYFASTITAFIVEGDLKNMLFQSRMKKRMKRMKDHIVVAGAGSTGRNVITELLRTGVPSVAVDVDEHAMKELAEAYPKAQFAYFVGDATNDDMLEGVNLPEARGLVAALNSDKDNLYLVVSARQVNPSIRIVARCTEMTHVEKLRRAGADAVVSPNFIGGMRMVSEMMRPAVVKFLDDMLRDKRSAFRIEDVKLYDEARELGRTLREARVRERFGMTVLAVRPGGDETWQYNPEADAEIGPGTTLVVLGSPDQVAALRRAVGEPEHGIG
jgi:voltage-gated potassium channel